MLSLSRLAMAAAMTKSSQNLVARMTVGFPMRSETRPAIIEKIRKGATKTAPEKLTKELRRFIFSTQATTRRVTRVFRTLSLNAPKNCVTMSAQNDLFCFFSIFPKRDCYFTQFLGLLSAFFMRIKFRLFPLRDGGHHA